MPSESSAVSRGPCDCGSSDGCVLFDDGHTHCYVCGTHTRSKGGTIPEETKPKRPSKLVRGEHKALASRKITEETAKLWGTETTKVKGEWVLLFNYANESGQIVAQKIRTTDKSFSWNGDHGAVGFYGRHLWRDSGKKLVITEGEIDAMSVSQVQQHKWPVVSIPDGAKAAAKTVKANIDWLEKFEQVVFMFDMDEPGQEAAKECAALLSPGKAFIARLEMKDANEMLVAGKGAKIIDAIWGAKEFRPDGIVSGKDIWEKLLENPDFDSVPYPWEKLNAITRGCRRSEVVTVVAGTGVGKSEVVRQIASHFHDHHSDRIGYVALEESVRRTALGLIGLKLGKRVHLGTEGVPTADLRSAYDATVGSGRYDFYDHFGSMEGDQLLGRIRYMVVARGARTVILDHLSIVVSGLDTNDERKTIDNMMTKLRSMVQELGFRLILINHLRRVEGTSHEDGGQISLNHLRGSGSIAQLSDIVIALERDQQSETRKNYTRVRVLKNRFTGETGTAGWLKYEQSTGRLVEEDPPKEAGEEVGF